MHSRNKRPVTGGSCKIRRNRLLDKLHPRPTATFLQLFPRALNRRVRVYDYDDTLYRVAGRRCRALLRHFEHDALTLPQDDESGEKDRMKGWSTRVHLLYKRPEIPANMANYALAVSATYRKLEKAANPGSIPVGATISSIFFYKLNNISITFRSHYCGCFSRVCDPPIRIFSTL